MTVEHRDRSDSSSVETIDLTGEWRVSLDPDDVGVESHWYDRSLQQPISLPGTTDEAELGDPSAGRETGHLTRAHRYEGPAWYQRQVDIPGDWETKRVTLRLDPELVDSYREGVWE